MDSDHQVKPTLGYQAYQVSRERDPELPGIARYA